VALHCACDAGNALAVKYLLAVTTDVNRTNKKKQTPLFKAAFKGHDAVVRELLSYPDIENVVQSKIGADMNLSNIHGVTPLQIAVMHGPRHEHSKCMTLLIKHGADIDKADKHGNTALHSACLKGSVSSVKLLLDANADINRTNKKKQTPLFKAALKGHTEVVRELLSHPDIDIDNHDEGATALFMACKNNHPAVVELLLNHSRAVSVDEISELTQNRCAGNAVQNEIGADMSLSNITGMDPLHIAAIRGNSECVKLLIEHGADIDQADKHGNTALSSACLKGHVSSVQLLLDANADINHTNKKKQTPLFKAAFKGHDAVVRELLSRPDIDIDNHDEGATALWMACRKNHPAVVELLLNYSRAVSVDEISEHGNAVRSEIGADMSLSNINGIPPLQIAAINEYTECVTLLIKHGADINKSSESGNTALSSACDKGHVSSVKLLLDANADINRMNKKKETPLIRATLKGHDAVVRVLLSHPDIDIGHRDCDGETALFKACEENKHSVAKLLLEKSRSADDDSESKSDGDEKVDIGIGTLNTNGDTPLSIAANKGHSECVELLIEHSAHIIRDGADIDKETVLFRACFVGNASTVNELLSANEDVNALSECGSSPLHAAAVNGHASIVTALLRNGADVNATDKRRSAHSSLLSQRTHRRRASSAIALRHRHRLSERAVKDCAVYGE